RRPGRTARPGPPRDHPGTPPRQHRHRRPRTTQAGCAAPGGGPVGRCGPGRRGSTVNAVSHDLTLCLDTSSGVAVALLRDGEQVAAARSAETRRHVETLTPLITACLQQVGASPAEVTEVAVGTGPAPFTGLRVGLVTARTFAAARGIPAYGVSSLEAVAADAAAPGEEVLVATDARRREVYWGRYREALAPAAGTDQPEVGAQEPTTDRPSPAPARAARAVDAATVGRLARARSAVGLEQPTQALYLRTPDIAPPSGRKRAS